jgi:phage-related holin
MLGSINRWLDIITSN